VGFAGGDVNLYRAVGNNPPNALDPLGLSSTDPENEYLDKLAKCGGTLRPGDIPTQYDPSRSQRQQAGQAAGVIKEMPGHVAREVAKQAIGAVIGWGLGRLAGWGVGKALGALKGLKRAPNPTTAPSAASRAPSKPAKPKYMPSAEARSRPPTRPGSAPSNAPPGTKTIDQHPDTSGRERVHRIKKRLAGDGVGPKSWVGISPDGNIIVTNPDGTFENLGPWIGYD
jgi:hypothetical protein